MLLRTTLERVRGERIPACPPGFDPGFPPRERVGGSAAKPTAAARATDRSRTQRDPALRWQASN